MGAGAHRPFLAAVVAREVKRIDVFFSTSTLKTKSPKNWIDLDPT